MRITLNHILGFLTLLYLVILAVLFGSLDAHGEAIPAQALRHRAELIRCARAEWGLDAPTATMAAQVHQESRWNADARSPVGAQGLAQFMPSTAAWFSGLRPDLAEAGPGPWNPGWALRALAAYDVWLWDRINADAPCERMALVLSAYNGGLGWVRRDAALARSQGYVPTRWWDHVERVNAGRSPAAWTENRGYPRRILRVLEPLYMRSGWGLGACHG